MCVTGTDGLCLVSQVTGLSSTTIMSDYDFRPGGSLRLKTGVIEGGITKKKKKTKGKLKARKNEEEEEARASPTGDGSGREGESSKLDRKSPSGTGSDNKTDAERRFEEVQRRRMAERVNKMAINSHKDRVHLFNAKLEALSEHHDIPKVGPG
ncbi:hypothetical protein EW145_g528 [Phellinidium pouzarii]|uniref:DUF1754-domain-containing protein n=1 Tax=Phellinidium pouzarii TaxID=167371 RepID=A0A4S4LHV9_9AGAM|nr:hypothetical protein EW145_g528 [Phellinidium pouzarii]